MSSLTIQSVLLNLNPGTVSSSTPIPASGSIVNLSINGSFQISGSNKVIGYYNNNFPLTSSTDLSASIADIDTLALAKVKADLGL